MKRYLFLFSILFSSIGYAAQWAVYYDRYTASDPATACYSFLSENGYTNPIVAKATDTVYSCIGDKSGRTYTHNVFYRDNISGDACSSEDLDSNGACSQVTCDSAKPVSSHTHGKTACYNQCSYTTLGGFRDFDNALSPLIYEYLPTGSACSGSEDVDLLADTQEYTEISDDESCRTDGIYQVCISDNESCKRVNGVEICVDHQTREDLYNCGTFNGEVVCFKKNAYSNCKYINGEYLCVYPEGNKIDSASVDHPGNGGNANGDDSDDILDQQDLTDNTPHAQAVKSMVSETNAQQIAQNQAENDNPSSSFSGIECDKTVSCSGDAIQCAMARMQKKQLCLSQFNESEVQKIINDNPQMSPLGTLAGDNLEIHVEDFLDTEEYVSADNQCPEPLSFAVLGTEYQIALTPLCDLASYISYFILFATWFSMSVILAKSLSTA